MKKTIGFELGLDAPKDIKIYNSELYILDSGNNRIVVLDNNYNYLREIVLTDSDNNPFSSYRIDGYLHFK